VELERRSTSDQVRDILLERILSGAYPPGYRIREMDVARELNTSQAPVREALRELQGLRVVTAEPYRGTHVRRVTDREMLEALRVRAVLEEAAIQGGIEELSAQVDRLRYALSGMRSAALEKDVERFAQYDLAFHRTIVEAGHNGCLRRAWESLGVEVRIRILLERSEAHLERAADAHESIVAAVANREPTEAGRLLRSHPESIFRPAERG
jgi:DNA-binding GntR family transcriptional regulator